MKFSVIVPVYNIENYLSMCIDSVLKQRFYDYELILIDDGSTDHSGEVCDQYSKLHKQVKTIHKENGGVSEARNLGIGMSSGEYIIFLDGDDMLKNDALYNIYSLINNHNYNVIIGNRTNWCPDNEYVSYDLTEFQQNGINTMSSLCEHIVKRGFQLPWPPYQTIYNRMFLLKSHVKFNIKNSGAEDAEFFFEIIPKIHSFKVTSLSFVNYRLNREGSTNNTKTYKTVISQLLTFRKAYNNASGFENPKLMKMYFANCYTSIAPQAILIQNSHDRATCINFIKNNKNIIQSSNGFKYVLAKIIWHIFGYKAGSQIILKLRFKRIRDHFNIVNIRKL
ncbi:glycosyltransferase family 2 protein [Lactiplantibacillus plantarum]|nr:glycosyltransferase family 2 protein [Lactiplantibacillus plantarum]